MLTCRKPRPWIATSSELPVWLTAPWVNSFSLATTRTPVPISRPEGDCVCSVVCAPGWPRFWYIRSWNAGREALKPVVLALARLLEMASRLVCCASRPVLAIQREENMAWLR